MTDATMDRDNTLSVTWSAKEREHNHVTGRALLFLLSNTTYGISVDFVRRVLEMPAVDPVPGSSDWFLGMVNCDGVALPLINPHALFNTESAACESTVKTGDLKRAIVIDCAHGTVLLAVDQITTLADLSARAKHETTPAEYPSWFLEYSCEANEVTIGVVNIVKLFESLDNRRASSNRATGSVELQPGAEH